MGVTGCGSAVFVVAVPAKLMSVGASTERGDWLAFAEAAAAAAADVASRFCFAITTEYDTAVASPHVFGTGLTAASVYPGEEAISRHSMKALPFLSTCTATASFTSLASMMPTCRLWRLGSARTRTPRSAREEVK